MRRVWKCKRFNVCHPDGSPVEAGECIEVPDDQVAAYELRGFAIDDEPEALPPPEELFEGIELDEEED
jgi:hypothetical protein